VVMLLKLLFAYLPLALLLVTGGSPPGPVASGGVQVNRTQAACVSVPVVSVGPQGRQVHTSTCVRLPPGVVGCVAPPFVVVQGRRVPSSSRCPRVRGTW
jgi:hypothetical protein